MQPSSQPPNVVCIEMPWPSFLCVFLDRPGQVFKLSRGGLARHNFPYADLPAFIDPKKTNECVRALVFVPVCVECVSVRACVFVCVRAHACVFVCL